MTPAADHGRARGASSAGRAPDHARHLVVALALAALALPGALPGSRGEPDPVAFLVWIALVAAPVGALAGGSRLPAWPHGAAIPGAWMLVLVAVDALGARDLDTPLGAALAASGLFALGFALGRWLPRARTFAVSAVLAGLSASLIFAPVAGAVLGAPWPGGATARLLDASPATLLAECAGVDWLRHPAIYDAAGSADIDPRTRSPYSPVLAAGIVLVLGCMLALFAERSARARERSSDAPLP
ncbi:MAG: hypothetical protein NTY35_10045 [Planctomycetota bacterium]|nr:hypothetical protein [Planctomycetota bacterium]